MNSSNNIVMLNQYTLTSLYLTPIIFNRDALANLSVLGLVNVYLDDYGTSRKYTNCLFFLFKVREDKEFNQLEKTIANFNSFYDYYDVKSGEENLRMYVFKVHSVYEQDLFSFRHNRIDELSIEFWKVVDDDDNNLKDIYVNPVSEIYRFNLTVD